MDYVWAILLFLSCLVFWALNVFGLPGNWMILAAAVLYAYFGPAVDQRVAFGWAGVVVLAVLATIGEVLEFAAGALGASQAGGSKRAAVLALIGSLVGGIVGAILGSFIPVPVIGTVIGTIVVGGLGAFGGAVLGEYWKGRTFDQSVNVGSGAFVGRILGTLGKMILGAVMVVVLLVGIVWGPDRRDTPGSTPAEPVLPSTITEKES